MTNKVSPSPKEVTAIHTPGPWSIHKPLIGEHKILDSQGHVLAEVFTTTDNIADEDTFWVPAEANARLIAAAPELLAAIKQITAWEHVGAIHYPDNTVGKQLNALISRAEGRQP